MANYILAYGIAVPKSVLESGLLHLAQWSEP